MEKLIQNQITKSRNIKYKIIRLILEPFWVLNLRQTFHLLKRKIMKNYYWDISENYKEFIKNTVYVYTVSVNSRNKYLKYGHTFETTF